MIDIGEVGRGHPLGGDLCMVDFAEVGEGPPP